MPYASSLSRSGDLDAALEAVCAEVGSALPGAEADLTLLFVSHHHADHFDRLATDCNRRWPSRIQLGCAGETVIGGRHEIETGPALSLFSAVLPGAQLEPFRLEFAQTRDGILCSGFPAAAPKDAQAVFVLADPFTSAPHSLIDRMAMDLPGVPLLGGLASGGAEPGANQMFLNGDPVREGAVGVIVRGGPEIRSVVSQGCRPIGNPFVVTKAHENVILELGGQPTLKALNELVPSLSDRDLRLIRSGLHVGIAMSEYQREFRRGDFLISNVIGADQESGALAIASPVRLGQTIQFHVRDADAADEDLNQLLATDLAENTDAPCQAALLFSCNGRGTRLFAERHHDAAAIQGKLGDKPGELPLAGFFAQGELGPVGGKNYVHGFTASVALFT